MIAAIYEPMRYFDVLTDLQVQDKIDELTKLDRMLYRAGQEEFEKVIKGHVRPL